MNDRLAELQRDSSAWALEDSNSSLDIADGVVEMGTTSTMSKFPKRTKFRTNNVNVTRDKGKVPSQKDNDSFASQQEQRMKQFFGGVECINSDIAAIADATKQITAMKDRAVLSSSEVEEAEISDTLQQLVDRTNVRGKRCKNLLDMLKGENDKLSEVEEASETDLRVRRNLVHTILRKFVNEIELYRNAQEQYKEDLKAKVTHQVHIIRPDASDQEVDQIMRSEGGREALYQQLILSQEVNDRIKTQYHVIANKYLDVLTLEASVVELHQMFLDLTFLVEEQGEMLDQVEYHVASAKDYTEVGNGNLHEAVMIQKNITKKRCLIVLFVVVALVIIIILSPIGA